MPLRISLTIGLHVGSGQMLEKINNPEVVHDSIAEKLEMQGLWRRAAARWLKVMNSFEHNDVQREWIRRRCKYCCAKLTSDAHPESSKLDIASISRAASVAQEKMGITRLINNTFIFDHYKEK